MTDVLLALHVVGLMMGAGGAASASGGAALKMLFVFTLGPAASA